MMHCQSQYRTSDQLGLLRQIHTDGQQQSGPYIQLTLKVQRWDKSRKSYVSRQSLYTVP
jgi:hypothetical protein